MTSRRDVRTYLALRRRLPIPEMRRAIRKKAGLSQEQVAAVVGVTGSAVAHWETGKRGPSPAHLSAYVKLLEELGQ